MNEGQHEELDFDWDTESEGPVLEASSQWQDQESQAYISSSQQDREELEEYQFYPKKSAEKRMRLETIKEIGVMLQWATMECGRIQQWICRNNRFLCKS